jgi:hypothetical protein
VHEVELSKGRRKNQFIQTGRKDEKKAMHVNVLDTQFLKRLIKRFQDTSVVGIAAAIYRQFY